MKTHGNRVNALSLALGTFLLLTPASISLADDHLHGEKSHAHERSEAIDLKDKDPFGNKVAIFSDPKIENPVNHRWDDPADPLFRGFEVDEGEKYPKAATSVTINVYAVADEEYRTKHSNWTEKVYNIIETADNYFYNTFGINWVIQGYYSWTSDGEDAEAILGDLASDGSGLPDGLVIGFSDDDNFDAGGIAYVYGQNPDTGFSVVVDQGDTSTTYALRHEIGHNYGLGHDTLPFLVCMMNYQYAYSVVTLDPFHMIDVLNRTTWFDA